MKQVSRYEAMEFTYNSRTERDSHVIEMESVGWHCSSQMKKLKSHINATFSTEMDFEYYAHFSKHTF